MLESAAFTLAMSARATSTLLESASWATAWDDFAPCGIYIVKSLRTLHINNQVNAVATISQAESFESFAPKLDKRKGSMVGFISNLAPLLNYLRRRSPGPPFPPDHRQAGERGATNKRVPRE